MGTCATAAISWHTCAHHVTEAPVRTADVLPPAENITLPPQQVHKVSCGLATMLTRHVDQLVHTVLLLSVTQVLVGHNLHVLHERAIQQASQKAVTKRTPETRVQVFR